MQSKQKLFYLILSSVLVMFLLLIMASSSLAQSGTWTTREPMPTPRFGLSTCAVNGKIYAFGGYSNHRLSTIEEYDCATNTWTKKKDMEKSCYGVSTSTVNGKIYIMGVRMYEYNATSLLVCEYNPVADTYNPKKNMPNPRIYLSTSVVNGKIYAIGGSAKCKSGFYSTVEEYDPVTNTWTTKKSMPGGARTALASSVVNGKIYVIGGYDGNVLATVEEYDMATDTWTTKTDMPTPRGWLSTSVVNGKIYAIGGVANYKPLSTVEVYDPATDTWFTAKSDMPTARFALSTSEVDGKIYAIGGSIVASSPYRPVGTVEEYTPTTFPTVYPYNIQLSSHFMQPGIDTLTINTIFFNPQNHNFMAHAIFASVDSAVVDSVLLCDDGNHADGGAGDGLFSCYIAPQSTEDEFIIAIKTVDLDTASDCVLENAARFTTIGPVVLDSYTITSSDTFPNPGNVIRFQLTLKNEGLTVTAKNVTTNLISLDTSASNYRSVTPEYGDIAPAQTSSGSIGHYILFSDNSPTNIYARFRLDIASNGYMFWSDTFLVFIYPTSVREADGKQKIPAEFVLHQNYPNPFNPQTMIEYQLPQTCHVRLVVYNLLGQEIATLLDQVQQTGQFKVVWDGKDSYGRVVPSGVYFYRLETENFSEMKRMILLE